MNLSFSPFLKRFQRTRSVHRREFIYPAREWLSIIGIGVILFICGVGYAGYVFWRGMHIATDIAAAPLPATRTYDAKKVFEILSQYTEKEKRFTELKAQSVGSSVPDVASASLQSPAEHIASTTTTSAPVAVKPAFQVE